MVWRIPFSQVKVMGDNAAVLGGIHQDSKSGTGNGRIRQPCRRARSFIPGYQSREQNTVRRKSAALFIFGRETGLLQLGCRKNAQKACTTTCFQVSARPDPLPSKNKGKTRGARPRMGGPLKPATSRRETTKINTLRHAKKTVSLPPAPRHTRTPPDMTTPTPSDQNRREGIRETILMVAFTRRNSPIIGVESHSILRTSILRHAKKPQSQQRHRRSQPPCFCF